MITILLWPSPQITWCVFGSALKIHLSMNFCISAKNLELLKNVNDFWPILVHLFEILKEFNFCWECLLNFSVSVNAFFYDGWIPKIKSRKTNLWFFVDSRKKRITTKITYCLSMTSNMESWFFRKNSTKISSATQWKVLDFLRHVQSNEIRVFLLQVTINLSWKGKLIWVSV